MDKSFNFKVNPVTVQSIDHSISSKLIETDERNPTGKFELSYIYQNTYILFVLSDEAHGDTERKESGFVSSDPLYKDHLTHSAQNKQSSLGMPIQIENLGAISKDTPPERI